MQKTSTLLLALNAALVLGSLALVPAAAQAQMADSNMKPLVVIRFNQPHVYYDQQLYGAIAQAVAVKPDVTFDVVSNAPATGNANIDQQWVATASHNTQAVVATMQKLGVPAARMRVTGRTAPDLKYDETQVFAR